MDDYVIELFKELEDRNVTGNDSKVKTKEREGGPTAKTEIRFDCSRKIKDENPTFTYEQVALRAKDILEDPNITGKMVTNVYRSMGMRWNRRQKGKLS